jgi:hypothetical protein
VLMVCKEFMLQSGDAVSGSGGKHMVAMVAIMVAVARSIGGGAFDWRRRWRGGKHRSHRC